MKFKNANKLKKKKTYIIKSKAMVRPCFDGLPGFMKGAKPAVAAVAPTDLHEATNNQTIFYQDQKKNEEIEKFEKKWKLLTIVGVVLSGLVCLGVLFAIVFGLILPYIQTHEAYSEEQEILSAHEDYGLDGSSILAKYKKFSVATDTEVCSKVGADILRADGSAVDAAIAAGLCNGIAHCQSSGIGGGHFMVIYLKEKNEMYAIDAREAAPLGSTEKMFTDKSAQIGGLAAAIPGEIAGFWEAYKLGGKLPWKKLFEPSIKMCRDGFKVTRTLAKMIVDQEKYIRADAGLSGVFLNQLTNKPLRENETVIWPSLADTLELISEENVKVFYNGTLTKVMVDEINQSGGNVTVEDFNNYRALIKKPIKMDIDENFKILTQPPPSSGVLVSFIMKLMGKFNLDRQTFKTQENKNLYYHRLIEVFKHSYYFRSLLGDDNIEDMSEIENTLLNETFIDEIKEKIDDSRTFPSKYYGSSVGEDTPGTSHISVLANGNAVALTTTINIYFGNKVLGKRSGIIYNNQMDDFSTPGLINYFGLRPSVANYIKPGKRPMSSMSPTIILDKNNNVRLVIGASGGSKIISAVAQAAIENLWITEDIKECIDRKRVHHQLYPEYIEVEIGANKRLRDDLAKRGHTLKLAQPSSVIQGIAVVDSGEIQTNCDGRKGGIPDGD